MSRPPGTVRNLVHVQPGDDIVQTGLLPSNLDAVLSADPEDNGDVVFKALSVSGDNSPGQQLGITDSALAWHLLAAPIDLLKADSGPIPPDARWITVHPNGPGNKGQAVLIAPAGEDGAMRVIGGAGGRLNKLKLRGVKAEGEYKSSAAANQAAKQKARKGQIASDKALGLHEAKQKARGELFEQTRAARQKFVSAVAQTMGWDAKSVALDTSGLSPEAAKKAVRQHEAQLLKWAKEAVDLQRRALFGYGERIPLLQLTERAVGRSLRSQLRSRRRRAALHKSVTTFSTSSSVSL